MKRSVKGLLFFTLAVVAFFAVSAWRRPAEADITNDVATRVYTPEFDDWVIVYTNAMVRASAPDYNVSVTKQVMNTGVRFHVVGSYANTPAGLNWYKANEAKIRDSIAALCRRWTAEGFTISLNDFEFNIRKLD